MRFLNIAKFDTLSVLLRSNLQLINNITENIDTYYLKGSLKKGSGEARILYKPQGRLKFIQNNIKDILVSSIKMPDCVHGWVKGKSIRSALSPHKGMQYLYCFDIHSYFDSIHNKKVFILFNQKLRCSPTVARFLTKLSTYQSCLPQGSPCSPVIANLILFDFDVAMDNFAKKRGMKYTRLGDDILLSSNSKPNNLEKTIVEGLKKIGFKINKSKSKSGTPSKSGLRVLGVVFSSKITVSQNYRRKIEAILFNSQKSGLDKQNLDGRFNFRKHLYGRIAFIEMMDPYLGSTLRKKLDLIKD